MTDGGEDLAPRLAWFVANRARLMREFGLRKLALVENPDPRGECCLEWWHDGEVREGKDGKPFPAVYRSECMERFRQACAARASVRGPDRRSRPGPPVHFKPAPMQAQRKARPNDPCPCGSGRKAKKCCGV
ncbi:MAG: SEC-C metal-binding domain-containing protein [Planctomycetota bacterium]|nr:SEC-C metal-binding domain-containing protein [Planctomycetota bacterium]